MSITLTASAARQITAHIKKRGEGIGLRLGIKTTGCSGFAYVVDVADHISSDDVLVEDRGIKIVVNSEHVPLLEGTEIDFVRQGLNNSFRFRNPNASGECGCGESFSVDTHGAR
ncbi:MAG: iron-sulfur cluster assembly accessory protein [Proteobacteria bacterium]|nr:iron-sulfur cluster assembly accessory protein [Pseudomonadota bacterium]